MFQIKIDELNFKKKTFINKQFQLFEDKTEYILDTVNNESMYFIIKEIDFDIIKKDIIVDENGDDQLLFLQLTNNETNLESAKYKIEFWLIKDNKDIFICEKEIYFE